MVFKLATKVYAKRYGFGTSYYQNHIKLKMAYFMKMILTSYVLYIILRNTKVGPSTSKC